MEAKFNELTRVQIPAMIHLTKLGYKYYGKVCKNQIKLDPKSNILVNVFEKQLKKLNPDFDDSIETIINKINSLLNNDDLGREFYKYLVGSSPKLVDFDNIENNEFGYLAELEYKSDGHSFIPDITLFINGLPLVFVEVKKPNNLDGIQSEKDRLLDRLKKRAYKKFFNITQFMIFSNNMDYEFNNEMMPYSGAFYATIANYGENVHFNCFREQPFKGDDHYFFNNFHYLSTRQEVVDNILDDFSARSIKQSPEFETNLNILSPTHKILTSMCSKGRILFLIKYGITYVDSQKEVDGDYEVIYQKHIMRYQQMFATLAIKERLETQLKNNAPKGGTIWHAQGSGKTALAFYLHKYLTDFLQTNNMIPKFYFIVDRLDLLNQAANEFEARGLKVIKVRDKTELMKQFEQLQIVQSNTGDPEIVVVNIHKFGDYETETKIPEYNNINLQRIFIVDEAHRSYDSDGVFLANLLSKDKNAIKIALTGTPLLKSGRETKTIFGNYIHTYYYDSSIQDGYTLKIIREDVKLHYEDKTGKSNTYANAKVKRKSTNIATIYESKKYLQEFIKYIINDFIKFREIQNDESLGGMIVCETIEQAEKIQELFQEILNSWNLENNKDIKLKTGLVISNLSTNQKTVFDFKISFEIDILIVVDMLLTGFDAPRLKKMYLNKTITKHTLLQALTRVNRPYKEMKYGYVADFANIKDEYDEIVAWYRNEQEEFNQSGSYINNSDFSNIIESPDQINEKLNNAINFLSKYDTENKENFSKQIRDKTISPADLEELLKSLKNLRSLSNVVKISNIDNTNKLLDYTLFKDLNWFIDEVRRRINTINALINPHSASARDKETLLNYIDSIEFSFFKSGEYELDFASSASYKIKELMKKEITELLYKNIDKNATEYVSVYVRFYELIKKCSDNSGTNNLLSYETMMKNLQDIYKQISIINRENERLLSKYDDEKYVRVHNHICKQFLDSKNPLDENKLISLLCEIKKLIDAKLFEQVQILEHREQFLSNLASYVYDVADKNDVSFSTNILNDIVQKLCNEYTEPRSF
ncbi:type I restriction endonuclease subunit R [Mycoplasmopsis bovis]|uniref:type I restriction endonuclease subunit R n=1 Tax=Mycoplasmopsis bovis TaxID=28903 RepID=UPI003D08224B